MDVTPRGDETRVGTRGRWPAGRGNGGPVGSGNKGRWDYSGMFNTFEASLRIYEGGGRRVAARSSERLLLLLLLLLLLFFVFDFQVS